MNRPSTLDHSKHGKADADGEPEGMGCPCTRTQHEGSCHKHGCGFCEKQRSIFSLQALKPSTLNCEDVDYLERLLRERGE